MGQASTQAERDEEAAFYARNQDRIAALSARVVAENQDKLNSFSCYNKNECCDFMREYFANPALPPPTGSRRNACTAAPWAATSP